MDIAYCDKPVMVSTCIIWQGVGQIKWEGFKTSRSMDTRWVDGSFLSCTGLSNYY